MDLLKYEFMNGPDGSFNGNVGALVRETRKARMISPEHMAPVKSRMTTLHAEIQKFDRSIGNPQRNYINEILDELNAEDEIVDKVVAGFVDTCNAVSIGFEGAKFSIDEIDYSITKSYQYFYVVFKGYKTGKQIDGPLLIFKEVFRSVCNRYNVVFIDLS